MPVVKEQRVFRRYPEREGFSPARGFCLVDLSALAKELFTRSLCRKCGKGQLALKVGQNKKGFAIPLLFECSNR